MGVKADSWIRRMAKEKGMIFNVLRISLLQLMASDEYT